MMHIKKKGQITIYIILGMVILISFSLILVIKYDLIKRTLSQDIKVGDYQAMEGFISSCIDLSAAESGYYISMHAGWDDVPDDTIDFYGIEVTKVFDNNLPVKIFLLNLSDIEQNYAKKMERSIVDCIDDFNVFRDIGYSVEYDDPNVTIDILEDFSLAETKFHIKMTRGSRTTTFDEFPLVEVPLRIGRFYGIAEKILDKALANPGDIPVSYLNSLADDDIFYYVPTAGNSLVYILVDNSSKVNAYSALHNNDENYVFMFGEKFG